MYHSRKINIGGISMGGDSPVVIQSMTNTNTNDIEASVEQCIKIIDAGGDMVRLTTQSLREVESLKKIKEELHRRNYHQPLIADVHFQPKVAEEAARIVEKVRINPGNYVERKYTGPEKFSRPEQLKQMKATREKLLPLIRICRENNTTIRVGVNHGSLSERMLNWFGNSPEGMVESAMEFIRIFHEEDFHNLVISLKSSNTGLMIYANRLLAKRMSEEDYHYPIHIGVTEAGNEEDGRIKSALGIGSLLSDGIGDTIRVSLTEDPELEIPVAGLLGRFYGTRLHSQEAIHSASHYFDPYQYKRRISLPSEKIGGHHSPVVIAGLNRKNLDSEGLKAMGFLEEEGNYIQSSLSADFIYPSKALPEPLSYPGIKMLCDFKTWRDNFKNQPKVYPLIDWKEYGLSIPDLNGLHFIVVDDIETPAKFFEILDNDLYGVLVLKLNHKDTIHHTRRFFKTLAQLNILLPVILHKSYKVSSKNEFITRASTEMGSLLSDGFGDGIWLETDTGMVGNGEVREISFGILQASGTRISKTEYISCPSCGRTLFDIQRALKKIQEATSGFKGLKIGVMGCIVNGPGEMADADFGYVGAGKGLVSLYKGKERVKNNIPEEDAVEELVKLISEYHRPEI